MKKTKKRKSAVALLTKRKKFGGIFFRRWLVLLIVAAVVCIALADKTISEAFEFERLRIGHAEDAILGTINEGPINESNEFYMNRIRSSMAMREEMGTSSILFIPETGEIIANCEERIYLYMKRDEDKSLIYSCSTKDIEAWDEYAKERVKYIDKYDSYFEEIEIEYFYANDGVIIPGEFKVSLKCWDGDNSKIVCEKQFKEPQNIPEGYVRMKVDDNVTLQMLHGFSETGTNAYVWNKKSQEVIEYCYKRSVEEKEAVAHREVRYGEFLLNLELSKVSHVVMPTGENAVLIVAKDYNSLVQYGDTFILWIIIAFVASVVLALIWAKISYTTLKVQYDMEDYRKTLMNTMAHDLKSPLMSISGYAENLKNNVNTDKKDHYAESILGNVNYMNGIIESVLTLGKTENEKLVLKKEKTSVAALFRECKKKYELQMNFKSLKLNIEGDGVYNIDVSLFTQAIDNLVGNAVKYASDKSEVNVKISNSVISISNKCDSMPEVSANELCEAFVVGNENRSNKTGSGLGLAIVKNVCDLHKFNLEIKCENNEFTVNISSKKWC